MMTRVIREAPTAPSPVSSGNTIVEVGLPMPPFGAPEPAEAGGHDGVFLIVSIALLFLGGSLGAVAGSQLSKFQWSNERVQPAPDAKSYCQQLWSQQAACPNVLGSDPSRRDALIFLWDYYPDLAAVPQAASLMTSCPPSQGSRFRMNSFQSASDAQTWWGSTRAVFSLVNLNRPGPFPGWSVSAFDASNWSKPNVYFSSIKDEGLRVRSDFFRDFLWVEVVRTCEAPEGAPYPSCDRGGAVAFQHASGSGVAFNLGQSLVRLNKIDAAVFLAAQLAAVALRPDSDVAKSAPLVGFYAGNDAARRVLSDSYSRLLRAPGCTLAAFATASSTAAFLQTARSQIASELDRLKGGDDVLAAVRDAENQVFYREFGEQAKKPELTLIASAGILGVAASALLLTLVSLAFVGKVSFLQPLSLLAVFCTTVAFLALYGVRAILGGLGYTTWSAALRSHKTTSETAVSMLTNPNPAAASSDAVVQQAFGGASSTDCLDAFVETAASLMGYDTVVFQCQASASGYFSSVIWDVTRTRCSVNSPSPSFEDGGSPGPEKTGMCVVAAGSSWKTTPFPGSRNDFTFIRGGLALPSWLKDVANVDVTPYVRVNDFAALSDSPVSDPAAEKAYVENLKKWLKRTVACDCVKTISCLGCRDSVAGELCR